MLLAYVATATQLSRMAEELRATEGFTEPQAWETMVRTWHLEGLSVRPDHRMIGHTGFLITARRLAPGTTPPMRKRRPQGSKPEDDASLAEAAPALVHEEWTGEDIGERAVADKKVRRVRRDVRRRAEVEETGWLTPQEGDS